MDGFVSDYISAFTAEMGRQPTYEEYAQIMTGYSPTQLPVDVYARAQIRHLRPLVLRSTLADVHQPLVFPRSYRIRLCDKLSPAAAFPVHNTAETIFERLEAKGFTWRVYCDAPSAASMTGIIYASRLHGRFATNFFTVADFLEDAKNGRLPNYSFIEPNMWHRP